MNLPIIVNHVTDERKKNGVVVSTFSYLGTYNDDNGQPQVTLINVNNVIWPDLPTPLHHKEDDDSLEFVSVYDPTSDDTINDDDDINQRIVNFLENDHPQIYENLLKEIEAEDDYNAQFDGESDDSTEDEEEDQQEAFSLSSETTTDDATAPNN